MKAKGDHVSINGKDYVLGERLGGGLEGNVFDVIGVPKFVIKLVNDSQMSTQDKKDFRSHILWLKNEVGKNEELNKNIAFPRALLDDDLGYIMPKATMHDNLKEFLFIPQEGDFSEWYKKCFNVKKRLQIIRFLFGDLEKIHIAGIVFTDLSPNNILVHRTQNNLVFIDTDNMRKRGESYLNVLGTEGYMAPEIYCDQNDELGKQTNNQSGSPIPPPLCGRNTPDSDIFSAAIIAFQLLTMQHPFVGDEIEAATPEDELCALHCQTDYILKENTTNSSSGNPFLDLFTLGITSTPKIRDLFYRTFVDGKTNPRLRPSDQEFFEAFSEALDMSVQCEKCGLWQIYDPEKTVSCGDAECGNPISTQTVFSLGLLFESPDLKSCVDRILKVDSSSVPVLSSPGYLMPLSHMVIDEKEKFLYYHHIEKTSGRSRAFAEIHLVQSDGLSYSRTARITILDSSVISESALVHKATNRVYPIGKKESSHDFNFDEFDLVFECIDSRIGKIVVRGSFGDVHKIN